MPGWPRSFRPTITTNPAIIAVLPDTMNLLEHRCITSWILDHAVTWWRCFLIALLSQQSTTREWVDVIVRYRDIFFVTVDALASLLTLMPSSVLSCFKNTCRYWTKHSRILSSGEGVLRTCFAADLIGSVRTENTKTHKIIQGISNTIGGTMKKKKTLTRFCGSPASSVLREMSWKTSFLEVGCRSRLSKIKFAS